MNVNKEMLLKELKRRFGDLDNDSGCYNNGRWFSIASIVEIINEHIGDIIDKDTLLESFEDKYGDLNDERGCYHGDIWLSMSYITQLIEICSE